MDCLKIPALDFSSLSRLYGAHFNIIIRKFINSEMAGMKKGWENTATPALSQIYR
jgi:hypothetical protein